MWNLCWKSGTDRHRRIAGPGQQRDELLFVRQPRLPLPLGEVPPKGAERALSVTACAVPAPPKGEPRPQQLPICRSVTGRGAQRQLYLVPNVRNALAVGHADKSQFAALLGSLPGRQGKTACFNPIILYRLSWTSGYICAILKTKTVERGLRLCQK